MISRRHGLLRPVYGDCRFQGPLSVADALRRLAGNFTSAMPAGRWCDDAENAAIAHELAWLERFS